MAITKERFHIQKLYNEKAKNDANSSTLTQTLESTIFTSFKGEHKFIFELLQNADDASDKEVTEAVFLLIKSSNNREYLIFSHSGRHFTETDVEKICDNGQQYFKDKAVDRKKIGYKGIGFKSVFSIADQVHIISENYNFRFDQGYFSAKKEGRFSFPWPIIPIQNEENSLPLDIKQWVQKEQVTFVLQVRANVDIANEIKFIKENRCIMLFLRKIAKITLHDGKNKDSIFVQTTDNIKRFFINETLTDSWLLDEFEFPIDPGQTAFLKSLQDSECPQRMKDAEATRISYAARITEDNKVIPIPNAPLFSYLPTQVYCGFNFIVNADFLLNADRTRMVDNKWNAYLVSYASYLQFRFLAKMAAQPVYRSQIFKLLPNQPHSSLTPILLEGYKRGFDSGIKEEAFVPSLDPSGSLLKVKEVVFDSTNFYCGISGYKPPSGVLMCNTQECMDNFMKLFAYQITLLIDFDYLVNDLEAFSLKHKGLLAQQYIFQCLEQFLIKNPEGLKKLKDKKFVLSDKNELLAPNILYIPNEELQMIAGFAELSLVHKELLPFEKLLTSIGVRPAKRIEFIRGTIQYLIEHNGINNQNILPITNLVFQSYCAKELLKEDWYYLRHLNIKTKSNALLKARKCYLSDEYKPTLPLESVLKNVDLFISSEYIQGASNLKKWRDFFVELGVKANIEVGASKKAYRPQLLEKPYMIGIGGYLTLYASPRKGMSEENMREHYIENFIDVDLLEYANHPVLSAIIWEKLIEAWPKIRDCSKDTNYCLKTTSNKIQTTYLQYCFSHKIPVFFSPHVCLMTHDVFAPNLQEVIGSAFPVAQIKTPMSEEQAAFFGFKTTLTVEECLRILYHINTSDQKNNPYRYSSVLKYLAKLQVIGESAERVNQWKGFLLAQNNTLQSVRNLRYSTLQIEMPQGQNWIKELPSMHPEDMLKIAKIFNIPVMGKHEAKVKVVSEDPTNSKLARDAVYNKLSVIALIGSKALNIDVNLMLKSLQEKFYNLKFISAHRFSIVINGEEKVLKAYLDNSTLYFEKRYDNELTKYEFCAALSTHFEIPNFCHTYLYLSNQELEDYLQHNHLDPTCLPKLDDVKLSAEAAGITSVVLSPTATVEIEESVDQLTSFIGAFSFKDALEEDSKSTREERDRSIKTTVQTTHKASPATPSDLLPESLAFDPKDIAIEKAVFKGRTTGSHPRLKSSSAVVHNRLEHDESLTQSQRCKVGREGEKIIYEQLKYDYQKKYPNCVFSETKTGFLLKGTFVNKKTKQTENLELEVIWYNKGRPYEEDSGMDKDFTIKKNNIIRHIEVKSTPSSKKDTFSISVREWAVMKEFASRYKILRVWNVGTQTKPEILSIKNPANAIQIKAYKVSIAGLTTQATEHSPITCGSLNLPSSFGSTFSPYQAQASSSCVSTTTNLNPPPATISPAQDSASPSPAQAGGGLCFSSMTTPLSQRTTRSITTNQLERTPITCSSFQSISPFSSTTMNSSSSFGSTFSPYQAWASSSWVSTTTNLHPSPATISPLQGSASSFPVQAGGLYFFSMTTPLSQGITLTPEEIQVVMREAGIYVQNQGEVAEKISHALSAANIDKDNISTEANKVVNKVCENLKLNFESTVRLHLTQGIIANLLSKMRSVQTKSSQMKDSGGLDRDRNGGPSSGAGSGGSSGGAARGSSGSSKRNPEAGGPPASSPDRSFSGNSREKKQAGEELKTATEVSHQGTDSFPSSSVLKRKGLSMQDNEDKRLFDYYSKQDIYVGNTYDNGDCFFDSVSQSLGGSPNYKELRELCASYIEEDAQKTKGWVKLEMANDAKIADAVYSEYCKYIRYTASEIDRPPTWGRINVEGRMICEKLNKSLYWTEYMPHRTCQLFYTKRAPENPPTVEAGHVAIVIVQGLNEFKAYFATENGWVKDTGTNELKSISALKFDPSVQGILPESITPEGDCKYDYDVFGDYLKTAKEIIDSAKRADILDKHIIAIKYTPDRYVIKPGQDQRQALEIDFQEPDAIHLIIKENHFMPLLRTPELRLQQRPDKQASSATAQAFQQSSSSSSKPRTELASLPDNVEQCRASASSKQIDTDAPAGAALVYLQTIYANPGSQTSAAPTEEKQPCVLREKPKPVFKMNNGSGF